VPVPDAGRMTTETCLREIIIKERIVFGRCVCEDWIIIDYFKIDVSYVPKTSTDRSSFKIATEYISFYVSCILDK
jgi:hypothetical protein